MIGAREGVARRLRTPGLAAVAAALVFMLVMLVGVHPISDHVVEHAKLVCAAGVLVLGLAVSLFSRQRDSQPLPPARRDTRPRRVAPLALPVLQVAEARSLPLRR